jgi:hypothetical protein
MNSMLLRIATVRGDVSLGTRCCRDGHNIEFSPGCYNARPFSKRFVLSLHVSSSVASRKSASMMSYQLHRPGKLMLVTAPARAARHILFAVVIASSAAPVGATAQQPTAQATAIKLPTDTLLNTEVDAAFVRWSAAWMFDRYLGNVLVTERGLKDSTYVIRGVFDFARMGSKITIPFAAAYSKADAGFRFSNLCYKRHVVGDDRFHRNPRGAASAASGLDHTSPVSRSKKSVAG